MITRLALFFGVLLAASGCASSLESPDYKRHNESRLTVPYDRDDVIYFDVKLSVDLPENDTAAEQTRMEWLQAWLDFKNLCPNGYQIKNKRKFRFEELNAGRYDLRYEVACSTAVAAG